MDWIRDHQLILVLLLLYAALMIYHAWRGNRQTKSLADYYIGGRSLGGIAIGLSFFATYSSTNSFLGFSGKAYSFGLPWLLLVPFVVFFSVVSWMTIAPRLRDFTESLDSVTIPDFIGFRFGSTAARVLAALILIFASILYMTAVFKGIGNLVEASLDVPYGVAILIVLVIVMAYTAVGGFHSVVKTDVVQGLFMVVASVLLFTGVVRAAGGVGTFFSVRDEPGGADLFSWDAAMPWPLLLGILFATTVKCMVEPRQLSRFYALEDRRAARVGMWVSSLTFLVVYSLLVPIGIYARRILPAGEVSDTDKIVPGLIGGGDVFHPGVAAFLFLAIVSAALSSLDSVLLVVASTCQRDLVGIWRKDRSERRALRATRIYVVLFAIVTALVALNPPGGIVQLTSFSGSLYAAGFMPAIVLGLYWRRGNGAAVIASFVVGIVCLFAWKYTTSTLVAFVHPVFPALALSLLTYAIVAWCTEVNESPEVCELFSGRSEKE